MTAPVLWWVSWEERESPEDERPLRSPPGPDVIAWWRSGYTSDDAPTMVALVVAPTEADVEKVVAADWPSKKPRLWRFVSRRDARPLVVDDRFPFSQWSIDRLTALKVEHDVEVRS